MESLDDVIDAMIADRVIHRHRRKWLIAVGLVLVLAVVIFFTGGWKEHQGRSVDTLEAPTTLKAGRFEIGITNATIIRTPKTEYEPAKARLEVELQLKNIDEETHVSASFQEGDLLRWVLPGKDPIKPKNGSCKGVIGYVLVYGLPAENCIATFEVSPRYSTDEVEIGVLAEEYAGGDEVLGLSDAKFWGGATAQAVVRVPTKITTETDG
ncbi:hypothetical protein [Kribbella sp. NPDC051718]|uniref:hypothetical protein n=1 Tax=Kribbella sp. NPDC051718 TaxID=3155168 RepID=UPI003447FA66